MRAHVERREGRAGDYLLPLVRELRSRVDPRKWLFVGSGLALFVVLLAGLLIARHGHHPGAAAPSAPPAGRATKPAPAAPLADPVLSRARAALAAGRYESPPGRNALDLFAAALLSRPDDVEAQAGLATTITRLLQRAERAAAAGNADEARRIAGRVLGVQAGHPGARSLLAGLEPRPQMAPVPSTAAPRAAPVPMEHPTPTATTARTVAMAMPPAAVATAAAQPRRSATPRVQKDPLTPVVIGNGTLPTSPGRRTTAGAPRQFGAPASSGHPIAGYVQRAPDLVATTRPGSVAMADTVATAPLPDRDLEPVSTPDPAYPPVAFRNGAEGWVELDFTVTEQGTVRDVEVVNAEPAGVFDAAAVAAVAAWRYRPRVVNGRPVMQRSSVTLSFNVAD
jgi:protein TonB